MQAYIASETRGRADHGWLLSRHTFSFADYHNPEMMGFRSLRVINEDEIKGGQGFAKHGHRDMEILTFVLSGALEHKDTLGNSTVIRPGEMQRMSAGSGIMHSEFNHLSDQVTHFYQIWILPDQLGLTPSYEQKSFSSQLERGEFVLLVSPSGERDSVKIHQDARVWVKKMPAGEKAEFSSSPQRYLWVQVLSGKVRSEARELNAGDALKVESAAKLELEAKESSEVMIFDLA